ncbi:MAG: hypothetical protein J7494_13490 [Sphingobium sp.]|nr:hypothetical protein [Sphingobium sp.]
MRSLAYFVPILIAAQAASAAPPPTSSAAIFSTVGHSEWCPAGTAYLDLRTGRYELMPRADRNVCHKAGLERRVTEGRLGAEKLDAVRKAQQAIGTEGLTRKACREGRDPEEIVISNGGRVTLVISDAVHTESAPENQSCWTDAARTLHQALERAFGYAS